MTLNDNELLTIYYATVRIDVQKINPYNADLENLAMKLFKEILDRNIDNKIGAKHEEHD